MAAPRRELLAVGATLALDSATAELVRLLRDGGVRAIVLKGPAIARLLYGDAPRSHDDIDLLVAPTDVGRAGERLSTLGFRLATVSDYAQPWIRADGVTVDLHTTLIGLGASPERAWDELARATERLQLRDAEVEVLAPEAVAMHVALHAAQHGVLAGKALTDLTLALERLPEEVWTRAADLARRLEAAPAFAAGLRLVPAGEDVPPG